MRATVARCVLAALLMSPAIALAQSPAPSTSPSTTAAPDPMATYRPQNCEVILTRAGLMNLPITADNLGRLMAQALRDHGYSSGSHIDRRAVGRAIVDFAGCFNRGGAK